MLVLELNLDEGVILRDRSTGEKLAEVKIASFIQYPTHLAARLGFGAPQNISILRSEKKYKGLRPQNGDKKQR